jgi:hypothetical protein
VYRAYYHDIISKPGAARVDVSDVQLRWLHKRADMRKPTLQFNEFRKAFLELAPHYYFYEGDRVDGPAIITPDMSTDPELSVADHPDAGEDESEQATEPEPTEQPAPVDVDESSQEQPKVSRAHIRASLNRCLVVTTAVTRTGSFSPFTLNLWRHVSLAIVNRLTMPR